MLDLVIGAAVEAADNDRNWQPSRKAPSAAVRFLQCVIRHESSGRPKAENPTSTASGLFQFIDGTWRHYAQRIPAARRYGHAADAPAAVQWEVALLAVKWGGHGNWNGTGCGYGT